MNILIVSTYPPMVCGIGKYAEQQAAALRREGHRVDVLSPAEGGGDFQADLFGGWKSLRLLKYVWAYEDVVIHFIKLDILNIIVRIVKGVRKRPRIGSFSNSDNQEPNDSNPN